MRVLCFPIAWRLIPIARCELSKAAPGDMRVAAKTPGAWIGLVDTKYDREALKIRPVAAPVGASAGASAFPDIAPSGAIRTVNGDTQFMN